MTRLKLVLSFIAFSILGGVSAQNSDKFDIYLCIGQSNMAGRGYLEPMYMDTLNGVYLLNSGDVFEEAVNPFNRYSSIRKELPMQRVSISYAFAKRMAEESGREIGLVVNARGGSAIESWGKGAKDGYFEEAVIRVKEAMKYGELKGIIWHQGEANYKSPESYLPKLKLLVETLRNELKSPDVPFIFGEISRWNWTKREGGTKPFNKMLRKATSEIDNSYCISSKGLTPMIDKDDPHFSAASQVIFGERYADVMLDVVD